MFTVIPEFKQIGAAFTSSVTGGLHTIPQGANGVLLQALTANAAIEFDGAAPNADSLQLIPGNNPLILRMTSGRTFRLGQVTSGATAKVRYVFIKDRP